MKKYLHLIKISFINALDYRQELVTNFVISVLSFLAMAIFWRAVFIDHQIVKDFDFAGIMQYYIFLNIMLDIVDSKFAFTISADIVKGNISNLFLKPVNVKLWLIVKELGQLLPLVLIKLVVFIGGYEIFIGALDIEPLNLLVAIFILPFSYLINANIYFILGCIAFWVADVKGLLYGFRRIFLFLSGGYVPLIFFPETFRKVLEFLPFGYVFQLPMDILQNGISIDNLSKILLMLLWVIFLSIVTNKFYVYSYKSNESVGI